MLDVVLSGKMADLVADNENWTPAQRAQAKLIVEGLDMSFSSYTKVDGKRVKIMQGVLRGTVFSGHPTRTTFGNSVRVYTYTDFIAYLAKLSKYKIWVMGDDMLMIMERDELPQFVREFWNVYSDKPEGCWGLGQCSKGLEIRNDAVASFLSLNFIMSENGGRCFRNLPRF